MPFQLAYISQSRSPLDQSTLTDILTASVRNNTKDEITGVLMYHDDLFFQVLEGERSAVEDLYYRRICHDARHGNLALAWSDVTLHRTFPNWAMGYAGPDEIGKYTKCAFHSLSVLRPGDGSSTAGRSVALELARTVFADLQGPRHRM